MKINLIAVLILLISTQLFGQKMDTLTYFSQSFQQDRTIFVQTPEFYKYQSEEVKLPVIYLLDGQHEWFINPLISSIKYLQYTHEIPQALLVIIPLNDRNAECEIKSLEGEATPLHKFITEEIEQQIQAYHPNDYKIIIGHSFSASFALYSHFKNPKYYSSVIANTPLDRFEELVKSFEQSEMTELSKISISVGGIAMDKDYYHRSAFDNLKSKYPSFFKSINVFEADYSAHNATPIVSTPYLLTKVFEKFSSRYSKIAEVNEEYKLINKPKSVEIELTKIKAASKIGEYLYFPEIADINGIASRYLASDFNDYGLAVYELGIQYFPKYFEFHLALYELYLPTESLKAKLHLDTCLELIQNLENDLPDRQEIINQINAEKKKNGW